MDLLSLLLLSAVFLFSVSVVGVIFLAWSESKFAEKHTIKKRLYYISAGGKHGQEKLKKYRERVLTRLEKTKLFKAVKASKLYNVYRLFRPGA